MNKFNNIDEIIEYLDNYKKAEWSIPKETTDITGEKTYYAGQIIYEKRIFEIPSFLLENNYISKDYYNREKYPEFFEEDFHTWNIKTLDIKRISYLILRTYNIERMCEGAIDNLVTSKIFIKLIKRLKELKDNN